MSIRLTTPEDYENVLDAYDTWLFDCDGVLWHDDHLMDGVVDVLEFLRRKSTFFFSFLDISFIDAWT